MTERIKHELGYYLDAPLPTMLSLEEVYGEVKTENLDVNDPDQKHRFVATPDFVETTNVLANFINKSRHVGSDNKTPQISEEEFVHAWLPHFYNDENRDEDLGYSVNQTWVNAVSGGKYAGHYHCVDVIRDGKVIFRVPPMGGRLEAVGANARKRSVSLVFKDAEGMMNRLPRSSHAQFLHILDKAFEKDNFKEGNTIIKRNLKYLYVLDEIFTYYGYETILTPELMSIKSQVMGNPSTSAGGNNGTTTNGHVSSAVEGNADFDNDDDLFG